MIVLFDKGVHKGWALILNMKMIVSVISLIFMLGALTVAYMTSPIHCAVLILCSVLAAILSFLNPQQFLISYFIGLITTGFLNTVFHLRGLNGMLPVLYAGILGNALSKNGDKLFFQKGKVVFLQVGAVIFSALVGLWGYRANWTDPFSIVAILPWAHIHLVNAVGWILMGTAICLSGPLLFLTFRSSLTTEKMNSLLKFIYLAYFFVILILLLQILGFNIAGRKHIAFGYGGRYAATFTDPNVMGCVSALFLMMWMGAIEEFYFKKRNLVVGAGLLFIILMSGSRSSILLILPGALGLLSYLKSPSKKKFLIILGFAAFIGAIVYWQKNEGGPVTRLIGTLSHANSLERLVGDRIIPWKAGWATFIHHPIFGVGIGNYLIQMPQYTKGLNLDGNDLPGNIYLTVLAEQGLVGFGFFLLLMGWLFRSMIQTALNSTRSKFAALGLLGIALGGFFGSHLSNLEISSFAWLTVINLFPFKDEVI